MSNTSDSGQQEDILANLIIKLNSQSSDSCDFNGRQKSKLQHTNKYAAISNDDKKTTNGFAPNFQMPGDQLKAHLIDNDSDSFVKNKKLLNRGDPIGQHQSSKQSVQLQPSKIQSTKKNNSFGNPLELVFTYILNALHQILIRIKNIAVSFMESLAVFTIIYSLLMLVMSFLPSVLAGLIVALAAVGTSLGLRKMYVKALLKVFEYATNIKEEKLNNCEELLDSDTERKNAFEKAKDLARLRRLRKESFMLNPSLNTKSTSRSFENDELLKELNEVDLKNNNYKRDKSQSTNGDEIYSLSEENGPNRPRTLSDLKRDFQLGDIIDFVHQGMNTIIDDEVTKRFTTEELTVWNLLSRTNQQYEYVSFRVTFLWTMGFILRYCILFPFRLILFILACFYTFVSTALIGMIKNQRIRIFLNWYGSVMLHRILSRVFSAIITFHNKEHRAKPGSICVANHTSPIDVIILSTDNVYSMIGQKHGGFTGMMQNAFSRASKHIWFDRSESKDRGLVARRMREHIEEKTNQPILIFPEGTCINNTSVMMFKKGCFEIDAPIYPVAIKYDLRFGDAFWNSNKHSMLQYLLLMMTSWAIVVDVYYLPAMEKKENESAAKFASRVKSEIVKKGSFADLNWDGMLKRTSPKLDLMYEQQQKYVRQLKID